MRSLPKVIKMTEYDGIRAPVSVSGPKPDAKLPEPEKPSEKEAVSTAFEAAKKIVDAANSYSARQLQEANERMSRESAELRERSREEGYTEGLSKGQEEGYQKGYDEGYAAGLARAAEENNSVQQGITRLIDELEHSKSGILEQFQDDLSELALTIARTILKQQVTLDSSVLSAMICSALDLYRDQEWIRIHLSPALFDTLESGAEALTGRLADVSRSVKLMPCAELEEFDCFIELPSEVLDLSFDYQLKKIAAAIRL